MIYWLTLPGIPSWFVHGQLVFWPKPEERNTRWSIIRILFSMYLKVFLLKWMICFSQNKVLINLTDKGFVFIDSQLSEERFSNLKADVTLHIPFLVGGQHLNSTFIQVHLVNVAYNNWGEKDFRERNGHCINSGNNCSIHKVDGVAVQENCCTTHRHANNHWPENVLES